MCSLHVNDPFDAREESSHQRETTVITPDGDCGDADGDCGDADGADKSDDEDYYPPSPSSNPASKQKKKKNDPNPKLILDRSFMKCIRSSTFDHDPFRKRQVPLYTNDNNAVFDSNFKKQFHFNFSTTRLSKRQAEISASTGAS